MFVIIYITILPCNALEAILSKGSLRISNAKFLNDSEEIKYTIDLIFEAAETVFGNNKYFAGGRSHS